MIRKALGKDLWPGKVWRGPLPRVEAAKEKSWKEMMVACTRVAAEGMDRNIRWLK